MDGLVLGEMAVCVRFEAVIVLVPPVLNVRLRFCVPATNAALLGGSALVSVQVMPTMSLVLTTFQLASTALTVTLNAVPAVSAVGLPVLPVELPGDAVSPGTSSCSLANRPGLTGMAELVLMAIAVWVTFEAVTVWLPAVLNVTPLVKVLVPPTSAALAANVALVSLELRCTVSLVLIRFQLASTALTVTLNATAAV